MLSIPLTVIRLSERILLGRVCVLVVLCFVCFKETLKYMGSLRSLSTLSYLPGLMAQTKRIIFVKIIFTFSFIPGFQRCCFSVEGYYPNYRLLSFRTI